MQNQQTRAVIYVRDMSEDGDEQIHLDGSSRPPSLQRLLNRAAEIPRTFDVVLVATMSVLGTPTQTQEVIKELAKYGITVQAADGSTA